MSDCGAAEEKGQGGVADEEGRLREGGGNQERHTGSARQALIGVGWAAVSCCKGAVMPLYDCLDDVFRNKLKLWCDPETGMLTTKHELCGGIIACPTRVVMFVVNAFGTPWCLMFHYFIRYVIPCLVFTFEWSYWGVWLPYLAPCCLSCCSYAASQRSGDSNKIRFVDNDFPAAVASLAREEQLGMLNKLLRNAKLDSVHDIEWRRVADVNDGANVYLFANDPTAKFTCRSLWDLMLRCRWQIKIKPEDVVQGWLLSALACLAEFPQAIQRLFINQQYNPAGRYSVWIFDVREERWRIVTVDDRIPYIKKEGHDKDGQPLFAKPQMHDRARDSQDLSNELWVLILEKAMAKFCGSYMDIHKGDIGWAFKALTGDAVASYKQVERKDPREPVQWERYELDMKKKRDKAAQQPPCQPGPEYPPPRPRTDIGATDVSWGLWLKRWAFPCLFYEKVEGSEAFRVTELYRTGIFFTSAQMFEILCDLDYENAVMGAASSPPKQRLVRSGKSRFKLPVADKLLDAKIVETHAYSVVRADIYDPRAANDGTRITQVWRKLRRFIVWMRERFLGAPRKELQTDDENDDRKHDERYCKLLQVQNPWGYWEWEGDWSDESDLWKKHPRAAEQFELRQQEEGTFFMSWDDFEKHFDRVDICLRHRGMSDFIMEVDEIFKCFGPLVGCLKGTIWFLLCGLFKMWFPMASSDEEIRRIEETVNSTVLEEPDNSGYDVEEPSPGRPTDVLEEKD